jgi:hypothetical protein
MSGLKNLITVIIYFALCTSKFTCAQERVRLYATYSISSNGLQGVTPIRFLELFRNGGFKWVRQDQVGPGGRYELSGNELKLMGAIPAEGFVEGNNYAGKVTFSWNERRKKQVLIMCITSMMDWPPANERCQ